MTAATSENINFQTGTLVIAILWAKWLVLNLISGTTSGYAGIVYYSIVSFIIGVIVVACMFYAVHTERAGFLIPYLVFQVSCLRLPNHPNRNLTTEFERVTE
jgi:hypothetical protein